MNINFFSFVWLQMKKQSVQFTVALVLAFVWAFDLLLWPLISKIFVDLLNNYSGDGSSIWFYLSKPIVFGLSLWIGAEIAFRANGMILASAIPKLEQNIRMQMFSYVEKHSYKYFTENLAGNISNKISDMVNGVTAMLDALIWLYIPTFLSYVGSLVLLYYTYPPLSLIMGIWFMGHILICLYWGKRCASKSDEHSEERSHLSGRIVDVLTNMITVKLFAKESWEERYIAKYQDRERVANKKSLWEIEWFKVWISIYAFVCMMLIYNALMIWCWKEGYISVGDTVFIFYLGWNMLMLAWINGMEIPRFFKQFGSCQQAFRLLSEPHGMVDQPQAQDLHVTKGEIIFDKVHFSHVPDRPLFQDKSLTIKPGEKVGLVGFSGSGKTTFVNLLLRNFEIDSGSIRIDGQDISKVTQYSLKANIALIPQDISLFHRSLLENIRYGKEDASDEAVIHASCKAHAHDFIEQLPDRYQTLVGERGIKLSGGQRQRIAIARAILKNAPILILDEATSSLDSQVERKIQDALGSLMQGRTTIVIAHRLSTIVSMDNIFVFDHGTIVEQGTHEELIRAKGHYAKLWNMQVGGFIPDVEESL